MVLRAVLKYFDSYQKAIPFLTASLVLFLAVILMAIGKPLLQNFKQVKNLNAKNAMIARAPARIQELQTEFAALTDSEIKPYQSEIIFSTISSYCSAHNLRIELLPNAKFLEQDDLTLVSQSIELEGGFKELLGILYLLEREQKLGVINSAHFYTVKDRKTKKENLRLQFVLRNIIA